MVQDPDPMRHPVPLRFRATGEDDYRVVVLGGFG